MGLAATMPISTWTEQESLSAVIIKPLSVPAVARRFSATVARKLPRNLPAHSLPEPPRNRWQRRSSEGVHGLTARTTGGHSRQHGANLPIRPLVPGHRRTGGIGNLLYQFFTVPWKPRAGAKVARAWGESMQVLTFGCPLSGRVIDAGVSTDSRTLSLVRDVTMRLRCPYCGLEHHLPIERGSLSQPLYWPSQSIGRPDRFASRRGRRVSGRATAVSQGESLFGLSRHPNPGRT